MKRKNINKINFRHLCITFLTLLLVAAATVTAIACSTSPGAPSTSDSDSEQISRLESRLEQIRVDKIKLESEYSSKIEALESALSSMMDQMNSVPLPSETDASETKKEFFGFVYREEAGGIEIISYEGNSEDLIIPASINGKPVTRIGDGAFQNSNIRSVSVPQTVKEIGWFAFNGCARLCHAVLSENITSIGYEAFSNCKNLVIYAPNGSYAYRYAASYGLDVSSD